jgi:hypothetical protein
MFKNQKIQLLGALILIVATVLVTLSAVKPPASVPDASAYSDYFQRHPEMFQPNTKTDLSDYFLRHPELTQPNTKTDLSDYFLRHPGVIGH